ncbi:MAG: hypothetical protein AVDCRST_MAG30-3569 [uncultured Solirubrobacteraceae bacterium]|uniref:Polynucleotide kinase 3-phosphatase-like n=1 Tax=uncultured Solirubrobacteraceae bacterium TaxID=1162706 RepID=A0A6J4TP66_9ACTN|nr:MAG: hypothetical protein AVDCRST_MAG30-3569 [uncultured Solirubrobacteraceae bacterium]
MEAVILCGIQASGKTTLYRDRFLETHVRISLDLLRTRHREACFLETCLETRQPFVVDKTNETVEERRRYLAPARAAGFTVVAYLVEVEPSTALDRNVERPERRRVPVAGLLGTRKRLVPPSLAEGFDAVYRARPAAAGGGWEIVQS